ncbi:MAG: hypothetical protein FJ297_18385 [Planctomycetes bacterium]|nr:hypothetical protein [Planctomycetota bacterium]
MTRTQCLRRDDACVYAAQFHVEMAGTPETSRAIIGNFLRLAERQAAESANGPRSNPFGSRNAPFRLHRRRLHRARLFDPLTGRFISKDPLGFAAGDCGGEKQGKRLWRDGRAAAVRPLLAFRTNMDIVVGSFNRGLTPRPVEQGADTPRSPFPRLSRIWPRRGRCWLGAP